MPDPNSGVREDIDVKGKDLTPAMTPAMTREKRGRKKFFSRETSVLLDLPANG
jgi:hypothetical protein